jgi:hypothetical protein
MDSNSRSPASGEIPERPVIGSPAITFRESSACLRAKGFDPFAEILRGARPGIALTFERATSSGPVASPAPKIGTGRITAPKYAAAMASIGQGARGRGERLRGPASPRSSRRPDRHPELGCLRLSPIVERLKDGAIRPGHSSDTRRHPPPIRPQSSQRPEDRPGARSASCR